MPRSSSPQSNHRKYTPYPVLNVVGVYCASLMCKIDATSSSSYRYLHAVQASILLTVILICYIVHSQALRWSFQSHQRFERTGWPSRCTSAIKNSRFNEEDTHYCSSVIRKQAWICYLLRPCHINIYPHVSKVTQDLLRQFPLRQGFNTWFGS